MRFSADTNLQRIVFGGFGLKILCLTKQSLCFLSIAWIFEKQIGNEVFQNWCYIRHVRSWYALTYVLLLRLLVLSSKVKFHFSLGPLLHVLYVCVHMFVYVCGVALSSRQAELHASLLLCQRIFPTGGNTSENLSRCWFRKVRAPIGTVMISHTARSMFLIIFSQD